MDNVKKEKEIRIIFDVSVILKAVNAVVEIILGGFLLVFGTAVKVITAWINFLVKNELIEDPNDFVANILHNFASHLSVSGELFAALYLLSHGIVKLFLVINLLRNKLWAYPASLVVFGLFIIYQVIRFYMTHSIFMVVLTIFDLFVMYLVWHEYQLLRRVRAGVVQ